LGKYITFFLFLMFMTAILGGIFTGGGVSTTALSANISSVATTIPVTTTDGFAKGGGAESVLFIGDEQVLYYNRTATSFVGNTGNVLERGYNDTKAVSHVAGSAVYSKETNLLRQSIDYRISTIADTSGLWGAVTLPLKLLQLLYNVLKLPLSFLGTDLALVSYFYVVLSAGLVFSVGLALAGTRRV
jgi:hypothetical protein